ncbi:heparan sulfate 2-O-sulfotransferase pipe isoform X10 [Haematobia irritans]|uniref:heparan sulfate 2-O-sulfotransferase pipe isoform X10 n=1 Tax=Haematobia irritans TaxID=7368 RepID=UPI003F50C19D
MSLLGEKNFKMKMRDVETAFKYRRFPYPKRSVELIALLAISCTFFLFMHTNKLNSRLKEMEMKLQPSEFSALGLTGNNHLDGPKHEDTNTLHGTYQYLKSTGQLYTLNARQLNNTIHSGQEAIFFNRLEKVGSTSLGSLLVNLAKVNNFTPYVNQEFVPNPLLLPLDLERSIAQEINEVNGAMSYVEHINWINFTKFDLPKPIYVNLMRHPIQKVMSAYYFLRKPEVFAFYRKRGRKMESEEWFKTSFNDCVKKGEIPECIFEGRIQYNMDWRRFSLHFCGNKPVCKNFNSPIATQIAKQNIEREYAVVGSWEDTNITLTVLEHYIPRFFRGATQLYYSDKSGKFKKNATPHNTNLEPEVEAKLKMQFSHEIELYNFCKQRLYKQYIAIKKEELMDKYH